MEEPEQHKQYAFVTEPILSALAEEPYKEDPEPESEQPEEPCMKEPEQINNKQPEVIEKLTEQKTRIPNPNPKPIKPVTKRKRQTTILTELVYDDLVGEHVKQLEEITQEEIANRIQHIEQQPVHEQRSSEWYNFRLNMVTASEIAKIFGTNAERLSLLKSKLLFETNRMSSSACEHGIKFEPIARRIYEQLHKVSIKEYGCIRHPCVSFLGASPDGICMTKDHPFFGKLIEIKCPTSRIVNGIVPIHYALQVQTQLEVLNLNVCDYCEFVFKTYTNFEDYQDQFNKDEIQFKGIMIKYSDEQNRHYFIHSELNMEPSSSIPWLNEQQDVILTNPNYVYQSVMYWKLETLMCKEIKRNSILFQNLMPHIETFWKSVMHERIMS